MGMLRGLHGCQVMIVAALPCGGWRGTRRLDAWIKSISMRCVGVWADWILRTRREKATSGGGFRGAVDLCFAL